MSIFYRIIIVLLIIAASYSLFGIVHFKWMYHKINTPAAEFQISGNQNSNVTLIEFLNYKCGYCKKIEPVIQELLKIRKDIRYIARPVSFIIESETDDTKPLAENLTKISFAAGFQGKFWEMHRAFLEYPELEIPSDFIKETAEIYGLDYDLLIKDSQSNKIQELIDENRSALDHAGLSSVPSFMINNQIYVITDENLPDLKQLLDMVSTAEQ